MELVFAFVVVFVVVIVDEVVIVVVVVGLVGGCGCGYFSCVGCCDSYGCWV